ncbi:SCO family protein [Bacillus sp. V59.32b]|uniref:SCO family protein n=1 Tax=Bacillus sp. V59.32b TaxID=1758642 RepID=UPI0020B13277|nr:SCO family protein [Bacillus sp. V59.32b]
MKSVSEFEMSNVHDGNYRFDKGKIKLVSFFYTNCPDICPMTMDDLTKLQEQLKDENIFASEAVLISITLDPEFDDEKVIQKYADAFNADLSGWKWLRATPEETKQVANEFQMIYKKIENNVTVHNTTMYLVDEKNQIRATYDMANTSKPMDREQILEDIRSLLK